MSSPNEPAKSGGRSASAPYWLRSARLALGTASALGLARFAYGLLVPAMRNDLGWSLAQAGAVTTANGLGYLAGAVTTAAIAERLTTAVTFRLGMVVTALALAVTAPSDEYFLLLAARAVAGFAGALVFITGGVIASRIAARAESAAPITVYFSGTGLGIVLSGATIPPLLDQRFDLWPLAWAGLAGCAAVATLVSWTAARIGEDTGATGTGRRRVRPLWRLAVAYTLFATGYIAYITFLSAYLADQGASASRAALTWVLLGLGVIAAPSIWSRPIATWPQARALATLLAGIAGAAALALFFPTSPVVAISALVYGATFMSVPAAVTTLIRATTPPADWTPTLAAFTVVFAAGQAGGPWIAGALADQAASGAALAWTTALCATGAAFAVTHRASQQHPQR